MGIDPELIDLASKVVRDEEALCAALEARPNTPKSGYLNRALPNVGEVVTASHAAISAIRKVYVMYQEARSELHLKQFSDKLLATELFGANELNQSEAHKIAQLLATEPQIPQREVIE
jgi:hypothetical protein